MAGTREGAAKARQTNLTNNPNYYSEIGSRSWKNPERSRKTGFALNRDLAATAGAIGGKKKKHETKIEDPLTVLQEALRDSTDLCE
jgi:hypothetical protein